MKLSILICSYNKCNYLYAILKNLNNQNTSNELFEVCLIIDGSIDGTLEMVENINVNYRLNYKFVENQGLTNARNLGLSLCKGEYVVFCDDDVLFAPDYIHQLLKSINANPNFIYIGNIINIDTRYTHKILRDISEYNEYNYSQYINFKTNHYFFDAIRTLYTNSKDKNAVWWALVTGGNLCFPIDCFTKIGKFDPDIKGWGPEDADLCYRAFKQGYNALYNHECFLYHLDHPRNDINIAELMIKNACHIYKKYGKPKELSYYLQFMNGKLSIRDFNNYCCELYNIAKIDIPSFKMSMKDYTNVFIPTYTKTKKLNDR